MIHPLHLLYEPSPASEAQTNIKNAIRVTFNESVKLLDVPSSKVKIISIGINGLMVNGQDLGVASNDIFLSKFYKNKILITDVEVTLNS